MLLLAAVLVAGCEPLPDQAAVATVGGRPQAVSDGCPLTPQALAEVTSLRWELKDRRDEHPLETAESIKAMVCLFTAADDSQEGSDPLMMRVDLVEADGGSASGGPQGGPSSR
ncbi:hypothetical protein [Nonomuraea jabiensis]|uniref:hypothetical protein n=1 Tax=Nonomuraea jabiensis TaxID=882448 RepID=UPI003D75DE63